MARSPEAPSGDEFTKSIQEKLFSNEGASVRRQLEDIFAQLPNERMESDFYKNYIASNSDLAGTAVDKLWRGEAGKLDFKVNGVNDPTTFSAIMLFQAQSGAKVDGLCGPETVKCLEAHCVEVCEVRQDFEVLDAELPDYSLSPDQAAYMRDHYQGGVVLDEASVVTGTVDSTSFEMPTIDFSKAGEIGLAALKRMGEIYAEENAAPEPPKRYVAMEAEANDTAAEGETGRLADLLDPAKLASLGDAVSEFMFDQKFKPEAEEIKLDLGVGQPSEKVQRRARVLDGHFRTMARYASENGMSGAIDGMRLDLAKVYDEFGIEDTSGGTLLSIPDERFHSLDQTLGRRSAEIKKKMLSVKQFYDEAHRYHEDGNFGLVKPYGAYAAMLREDMMSLVDKREDIDPDTGEKIMVANFDYDPASLYELSEADLAQRKKEFYEKRAQKLGEYQGLDRSPRNFEAVSYSEAKELFAENNIRLSSSGRGDQESGEVNGAGRTFVAYENPGVRTEGLREYAVLSLIDLQNTVFAWQEGQGVAVDRQKDAAIITSAAETGRANKHFESAWGVTHGNGCAIDVRDREGLGPCLMDYLKDVHDVDLTVKANWEKDFVVVVGGTTYQFRRHNTPVRRNGKIVMWDRHIDIKVWPTKPDTPKVQQQIASIRDKQISAEA